VFVYPIVVDAAVEFDDAELFAVFIVVVVVVNVRIDAATRSPRRPCARAIEVCIHASEKKQCCRLHTSSKPSFFSRLFFLSLLTFSS
jgi:hypothetical protein